jgi:hypothetical protein
MVVSSFPRTDSSIIEKNKKNSNKVHAGGHFWALLIVKKLLLFRRILYGRKKCA